VVVNGQFTSVKTDQVTGISKLANRQLKIMINIEIL